MEHPTYKENDNIPHIHDVFLGEWAMEVCSKSTLTENRNVDVDCICRLETSRSYQEIFKNFLMKNVPFILGSWATSHWRSCGDWVTSTGEPNLKFFKENFGHVTVPVADCKREKYYSQPKREMTLAEYTQYWESYMKAGHPPDMENLYLKDWHFTRDVPDYKAYTTPNYFTSDWLNEFWDSRSDECDDYRFVYMGPKGSWTPFHADVFRSYSWSANICGRKKWIMFPPGEEENLKDKLGNLVYDVNSEELNNKSLYPLYDKVKRRFEVIQEAGEVIFVPSGWHHQVHNVEDTISINHNWINGCNIDLCWEFLVSNLRDVQREIQDCADMEGWNLQCQIILKASSGINFEEFYQFILTVAENRIGALEQLGSSHELEGNITLNCDPTKRSALFGVSDDCCIICGRKICKMKPRTEVYSQDKGTVSDVVNRKPGKDDDLQDGDVTPHKGDGIKNRDTQNRGDDFMRNSDAATTTRDSEKNCHTTNARNSTEDSIKKCSNSVQNSSDRFGDSPLSAKKYTWPSENSTEICGTNLKCQTNFNNGTYGEDLEYQSETVYENTSSENCSGNSSPENSKESSSPENSKESSSPENSTERSSPDNSKESSSPENSKERSSPDNSEESSSPENSKESSSSGDSKESSFPENSKESTSSGNLKKTNRSPIDKSSLLGNSDIDVESVNAVGEYERSTRAIRSDTLLNSKQCTCSIEPNTNYMRLERQSGLVLTRNQALFDLNRVEYVLSLMMKSKEFSTIDFSQYSCQPVKLLKLITNSLQNSSLQNV